jgi:hypothetical protein
VGFAPRCEVGVAVCYIPGDRPSCSPISVAPASNKTMMSMSKLLTRQVDGSSRSGPGASTTDAPSRSGRGGLAGSAARLTLSAASALCLKYAVPPYEREPAQAGDGRHVVARCVITEYPKLDLTVWEDGLVALAGLGRG